jgi:hypothetical protein
MNFELSPAAVLRVTGFSLETLAAFGDAELLTKHDGAAFRKSRNAVLERERVALYERTAGDDGFMKALCFASPSLFERVRRLSARPPERTKRVRHLETSLFRYLVRGATRTTPSGLWAGVALASFGPTHQENDRVVPAPPKRVLTPDLAPFARALFELGGRAPYLGLARYRINPTLEPRAEGGFSFVGRSFGGATETRIIAGDPAVDRWLGRVLGKSGCHTLDAWSASADVPRPILDQLVPGGVFVGGPALPVRFRSAWDALRVAGEALTGEHRQAWLSEMVALRDLADGLEAEFDALSAFAIAERLTAARARLVSFFAKLDVAVDVPAAPLRCDLGAPFAVTLGARTRASLATALSEYQRFWIDGASPASSARRAHRRALAAELRAASLRVGATAELPSSAPDAALVDAWKRSFSAETDAVTLSESGANDAATTAPFGCFVARLGGDGASTIFGVDDNPVRNYARLCALFPANNALESWLRGAFQRFAEGGVRVADLGVPFEALPNVLGAPELGAVPLEPWGVDGPELRGARVVADGASVVLEVPNAGKLAVLSLASAAVLDRDAVAASLAQAGFDERVDPAFRAAAWGSPDEGDRVRFAPRLRLPSGGVVRPRRTTLTGEPLRRLAAAGRVERTIEWWRLARELGWPDAVSVSIDGGPSLHVPASSPLGIESLLEGIQHARSVLVEEPDVTARLSVEGRSYVADLVLPFARSPHAYSGNARNHGE